MTAPIELPTRVLQRLTGQVPPGRIFAPEVPRHDPSLVATLLQMDDMTAAVADALDEMGAGSILGTDALTPLSAGMRVCGPAVTLRYVAVHGQPAVHRAGGSKILAGDRDLYGVARAGDVAVMDCSGVQSAAVMGGLSAHWAWKAGVAGCVVDGAVRDTSTIVDSGLPVWSRHRTPLAARFRIEALAINDTVNVAGVPVRPGDYVVGDDDGICIVPFDLFPTVVAMCRDAHEGELWLATTIADANDLEDLVRRVHSTRTSDRKAD